VRRSKEEKLTSFIDVEFVCNCGHTVTSLEQVPEPDFAATKAKDSFNESLKQVQCYECNATHEAYITNSFSGITCCINDADINVSFTSTEPDIESDNDLDWLIGHSRQFCIFELQIEHVKGLLAEDITEDHVFGLHTMLYGHTVAAIESYLASTFIHHVTNSRSLTRKLVETDPYFANQVFSLKELFQKQNTIQQVVANYLKDLIFHNIKKVKPMYKDVLNIDFGKVSWLFKAVSIRHDCVHRAGYSKNGNPSGIYAETVSELLELSWDFVCSIENQLKDRAPKT
jgi:hypothetical protein